MKKFLFAAFLVVGLAALLSPPVAFAQEEKPFTIHGEVRVRGEYDNNAQDFTDSGTDPGLGSNDDEANYWPYRIRIAAEGHFTKNISAWIEFQNAGVFGGDLLFGPVKTGTPVGLATDSGVMMYQGNVTINKLWSDKFSLQIGREEIVRGNELMLGDLDFYAGLSHDGVVGVWDLKNVDITAFYTRAYEGSVTHADNFLPPDQLVTGINATPGTHHFWGGYATWTLKKGWIVDAYLLDYRDRDFGADAPVTIQTVGGRFANDVTDKAGLVWNAEFAQQFGEYSELATPFPVSTFEEGADVSGSVLEGMIGWNFKGGNATHRVFGRYEWASGNETDTDSTPGDKEDEGFFPMYGDFHNRLGRGDWFQLTGDSPTGLGGGLAGTGGGGIVAVAAGYTGWFKENHTFGAQVWDYTLDQETDLGGTAGESDDLGSAFDLWYGYAYSRNLAFEASISQLSPGDALTGDGGPDDSVMRVYGQARLRF
ncbi:MAG TPA: hypothetical protein VFB95_05325 [Candidatus Cryosericum sp.]|nr:hypothetical protein [Candidatus Cryosericum sp.]